MYVLKVRLICFLFNVFLAVRILMLKRVDITSIPYLIGPVYKIWPFLEQLSFSTVK